MDLSVSAYFIGLGSSFLTELFKFIPFLNENELTRTITAFVVMALITLASIGFNVQMWDWSVFVQVLLWSFVNYKTIVQPVASATGLRTQ